MYERTSNERKEHLKHNTMDTALYGIVCSYLKMEHVLKARKYVT